jgi:hypothetical protein
MVVDGVAGEVGQHDVHHGRDQPENWARIYNHRGIWYQAALGDAPGEEVAELHDGVERVASGAVKWATC